MNFDVSFSGPCLCWLPFLDAFGPRFRTDESKADFRAGYMGGGGRREAPRLRWFEFELRL